ncbi:MAG: DUF2339 domain-containing protein [Pseudomonadota bacterium]
MTSLLFIFSVLALFTALLRFEAGADAIQPGIRQFGLVRWLMSGNWPAKVGAGLLILGVGALLRYTFININVVPEVKFGAGLMVSAILGFASFFLRQHPQRRALHLALAGAGFGVAYLTAYSAYGFFNYINEVNAFALLVLVAAAASVFAVSGKAMSVAILAMAGAYVAPAFTLGSPGPVPVYGYYLAASALSFVMVLMRGWRPLIHLSFLFTLAGGIFFGWSANFYRPEHYEIMQPLLLALVALHLAMPLVEPQRRASTWLARFDLGYFILLPVVAAILTFMIAPDWRSEGAIGLACLALTWALAGAALRIVRHEGVLQHLVVAVLLAAGTVLCRVDAVPWTLAALALAIATMRLAPRLGLPRWAEEMACGASLLFAFLHVIGSILEPRSAELFMNRIFIERIAAAALLGYGAWAAAQRGIGLAKVLGVCAIVSAMLAVFSELWRLNIDHFASLVYGLLLAMAFAAAAFNRRTSLPAVGTAFLMVAILGCGWWAMPDASAPVIYSCFVLTVLALLALAWSGSDAAWQGNDFSPATVLAILPLALLSWAEGAAPHIGAAPGFIMAIAAVAAALLSMLAGASWLPESSRWRAYRMGHFYVIGIGLAAVTFFHIERGALPIAFEVLALIYLVIGTMHERNERSSGVDSGIVLAIAATLVLQAMLLRGFGPDGVLTIADLGRMKLRAVVSMVWIVLGGGLAWWGVKVSSRAVWSAGAGLLGVAAAKLVLFDFGSLDQLGNILALIASSIVFLGLAWVAPFPPKQSRAAPKPWSGAKPKKTGGEPPVAAWKAAPAEFFEAATAGVAVERETMADAPPPPIGTPGRSAENHRSAAALRHQEPDTTPWAAIFLLAGVLAVMTISYFWREHMQRLENRKLLERTVAQQAQQAQQARQARQARQPRANQERISAVLPPSAEMAVPNNVPAAALPPPQAAVTLPAQTINVLDACSAFTSKLPDQYVLLAGGAYRGKNLNFPIDQSGKAATRFDVYVNEPGKNVVLALGAYEPSVWNIHLASGTNIAGLFLSGYYQQVVAGVSPATPILLSTYVSSSPCGYFYLSQENAGKADMLMKKIFGRSAQIYFIANDGRIDFGQPAPPQAFSQSGGVTVDSYRDRNAPLAGKDGLDQLMKEGKLRIATQADLDAVTRAKNREINVAGAAVERRSSGPFGLQAYVILAPMRFPVGLHGAHSVTFLLAPGVPTPEGNPGHSRVVNMETGLIQGADIRR